MHGASMHIRFDRSYKCENLSLILVTFWTNLIFLDEKYAVVQCFVSIYRKKLQKHVIIKKKNT